jgi:hypothetical protein
LESPANRPVARVLPAGLEGYRGAHDADATRSPTFAWTLITLLSPLVLMLGRAVVDHWVDKGAALRRVQAPWTDSPHRASGVKATHQPDGLSVRCRTAEKGSTPRFCSRRGVLEAGRFE